MARLWLNSEETWSVSFLSPTIIVSPRMTPKTFADRPINKLVLFDVDGTLTPARQVKIYFIWCCIPVGDVFHLR